MGNAEKIWFWKNIEQYNIKVSNEGIKREKLSSKKDLHTITKKKENNSTIDKRYDKHGNNVLMYETVKEIDEETITKENITLLT